MTLNGSHIDSTVAALASMASFAADSQRATMADAVEHFRRAKVGETGGTNRPGRPYKQVPPVRTAIYRKAMCLATMPLTISTINDQIIETGPLFDLIDSPNAKMSRRAFWIATSAWIDLSGACHWVMARDTWRGKQPTEIVPVSAWQMKPQVKQGELVGWKYRARGMRWDQAIDLQLDEVWTVALDGFDPDDAFGYSSPLETAGLAIAQIYKADLANEASLDNGVEPGGVFSMEGTPSNEQIKDLREEIAERHTGAVNRRRHLLLYGGIKWQTVATSFDEMEFSVLQKMKVVDVCAALDVDPAAIGYYENSTYAHADAAKASLWIDTCIPRGEWLADEFERGVVSRFERDASLTWKAALKAMTDGARTLDTRTRRSISYLHAKAATRPATRMFMVWFDDSRVPAVRKSQLERSKEGAIWIEKYLSPPADVIEALDLPLTVHDHQRKAWQPIGIMPVDSIAPGDDDPPGPPGPPTDTAVGNGESDDDQHGDEPGDKHVVKELSEAELAKLWDLLRKSWGGLERSFRGKFNRHVNELRGGVLKRLFELDPGRPEVKAFAPDVKRNLIGQINFNIVEANGNLIASVGPLVRTSYQLGGQQSMDEAAIAEGTSIEDAVQFNMKDPRTEEAMRRRLPKIADVNRTVHRDVANAMADGIDKGETTAQIAERVREQFKFASNRSNTIARTEVGAAVEESRQLGREQAKVPAKTWLGSRKETSRPWHMETERLTKITPVPNDQDFIIAETGNRAPSPKNSGVAKDDVNCGCSTMARYPGDQVKDLRLIRHLSTYGFRSAESLGEVKS